MKVFYFGCFQRAGHYLWDPGMVHSRWQPFYKEGRPIPWERIDGALTPTGVGEKEGADELHHKDGWTAWAFWDRTVDTRPGCNSVFFAEGTFTLEEMQGLAAEHFPEVWGRVKEIVGS